MQPLRAMKSLYPRTDSLRGPRVFTALALIVFSYTAVAELNCNVGIEFYPSGGIKSCMLNGNHRIYTARGQPLTCADGHVLVQYPDGKLKSCVLAESVTFDTVRCDRLSRVELGSDGAVKKCEPE